MDYKAASLALINVTKLKIRIINDTPYENNNSNTPGLLCVK